MIISCNGQEMIFFLKGNLMRRASPTTLAYWMYLLMGEGGDIKVIHKIQFSKCLFLLHEHLCQMCFRWWKTLVLHDLINFTLGRTAFNLICFCYQEKNLHTIIILLPSRLSNSYSNGIFVIYKPFVTNVHGVINDFVKTNFYDSPY